MAVDQLAMADLCYAPPYSPAMDTVITAADISRNKLGGAMSGISPMDVHAMIERGEAPVLLDVRPPGKSQQERLTGSINIPLGALREMANTLARDKAIVTFCKVSLPGTKQRRFYASRAS